MEDTNNISDNTPNMMLSTTTIQNCLEDGEMSEDEMNKVIDDMDIAISIEESELLQAYKQAMDAANKTEAKIHNDTTPFGQIPTNIWLKSIKPNIGESSLVLQPLQLSCEEMNVIFQADYTKSCKIDHMMGEIENDCRGVEESREYYRQEDEYNARHPNEGICQYR